MKRVAAKRLERMGSAIFAELAEWKEQARENGRDMIDLSIGSPDLPPSPKIMETLKNEVMNPGGYGYPSSKGEAAFREAVADWYGYRFRVPLDPKNEVIALMGSQDGLAHLALSVADPGDLGLVPDPGYPIYSAGLVLAGMEPYYVPLRREYGYLPNLAEIPADIARKAKLMIVNYPSNPLAAVADYDFFARLVHFARRHDILIAHDLAYSEMAFDGCKPLSILEIPGAKEVAVEFHSLSKSFNMAGCRIGFAVGHPGVISALGTLKANIDYGVFRAVQRAGIAALREDMKNAQSVARIYEKRRDLFMEELQRAGWDVPKPKATMFVWAEIPPGWSARQFSREMLLQTGVAVVPGDAFGREGEGFVRIALVQPEDKLREAASRIGQFWKGAGRSPCQT